MNFNLFGSFNWIQKKSKEKILNCANILLFNFFFCSQHDNFHLIFPLSELTSNVSFEISTCIYITFCFFKELFGILRRLENKFRRHVTLQTLKYRKSTSLAAPVQDFHGLVGKRVLDFCWRKSIEKIKNSVFRKICFGTLPQTNKVDSINQKPVH